MKARKAKAVKVNAPHFRSEAEEAEWWDQHQDLIADLLAKHGRRVVEPTKNISMRLPVADIERARKVGEENGIPYQTVIKNVLHEGLKREVTADVRHPGRTLAMAAKRTRRPKAVTPQKSPLRSR